MKIGIALLATFIFRWSVFIMFNKPMVPARLYLVKYHSKTDSSQGLREPLSSSEWDIHQRKDKSVQITSVLRAGKQGPRCQQDSYGNCQIWSWRQEPKGKNEREMAAPRFHHRLPILQVLPVTGGHTEGWREEKWGNEEEEEMPSSQYLWEGGSSG